MKRSFGAVAAGNQFGATVEKLVQSVALIVVEARLATPVIEGIKSDLYSSPAIDLEVSELLEQYRPLVKSAALCVGTAEHWQWSLMGDARVSFVLEDKVATESETHGSIKGPSVFLASTRGIVLPQSFDLSVARFDDAFSNSGLDETLKEIVKEQSCAIAGFAQGRV